MKLRADAIENFLLRVNQAISTWLMSKPATADIQHVVDGRDCVVPRRGPELRTHEILGLAFQAGCELLLHIVRD